MSEFVISEKRKAVWAVELKIMDEIDRICRKYDIKYFLAGGSMIGAARHNGFIPWDDDIDVGMSRTDYERFLEICKNELPSHYHLQTNKTDKGYVTMHAKIRDCNTTAIRKAEWLVGATFNQGIFVDVVPFDNIPDNLIIRRLHYYVITFLVKILRRHLYFKQLERTSWKSHIVRMMGNAVFLFTTPNKISRLNERVVKSYQKKKTKYIGEISIFYDFEKSKRERVLYEELIDHPFEDRSYKIPKMYDEILTQRYGDWRTPLSQAPSWHGAVFFDPEHPYTDYLNGEKKPDFDAPL